MILNQILHRLRVVEDRRRIATIERLGEQLRTLPLTELASHFQVLRMQARASRRSEQLLPEVFAFVREVAFRTTGMRHYPVQLLAGALMSRRLVVEMETGEGKTLTATLPLVFLAIQGNGVLLATANDYLASRDAELMTPIYRALNLSVGVIQSESSDQQRRDAYHSDITYGTASQFAFDFMRDRAKRRWAGKQASCIQGESSMPVGRKHLNAIIVDEADSLLIDEATTPLVIASQPTETRRNVAEAFQWAAAYAGDAREGVHYTYDRRKSAVELTKAGQSWARYLARPSSVAAKGMISAYEFIERAINVLHNFRNEEQYVILDGELTLVDERTGRLGNGRQWQDGIHQAIQAKEGLEITMPNGQLARLTIQSFFLAFRHISGMTGTASQSASELRRVYRLGVVAVPRNNASRRIKLRSIVVRSEQEKFEAICQDIRNILNAKRAVLIGTRTIEISNRLSAFLSSQGIDHQVLNANQSEHEANLVSLAGQEGKVTVATNMAGRGTDIKLSPSVRESGGLHVIVTELHDTPRVDRQLIGRCARQGESGSYRFILSLEDELLTVAYGEKNARAIFSNSSIQSAQNRLTAAQRLVGHRNELGRLAMLKREKQRLKGLWRAGLDPLLDISDN